MLEAQGWAALVTLTLLEIVLGIDNIIFISILAGKLPESEQGRARTIGLAFAMLTRIGLLFSLSLVMQLTTPLVTVVGQTISGRDMILIVGGLFLIAKSTHEIHDKLEAADERAARVIRVALWSIVLQIAVLDIVFSLDSVITAVGMANHLSIMVTAIVLAVLFMMFFSGTISSFVHTHPTIKMLALAFLLLIGVTLMAEGFGQHVSKGYIYFAMAFSVFVEMLNIRMRARAAKPVVLRNSPVEPK